ncbi:MAG TPA: Hsp20/alpha crystallin family protein [Chthoniobacteraceae bacterium]|jgi:HSP20 family protein|nr:hspA 2 [Chthoniobacter sp.]HEV7868162.1 Hsp20/alpha crystallin family protein [Chthoniobacteraceae bacterium]
MNATLTKTESPTAQPTQRVSYVTPPANIREDQDGYVLEAEMPGVGKDGLQITVENGELILLGRRTAAEPAGTQVYRESRRADYRRVFELDSSIDTGKISAKMEQGVLTLRLPKSDSVKPRQIPVTD